MSDAKQTPLLAEPWFLLSMHEITHTMNVPTQTILEIMEEGIINARKDEHQQWVFDSECLRKIKTIIHLNQDLGVNLAGAALVLELLAEIEILRAQRN